MWLCVLYKEHSQIQKYERHNEICRENVDGILRTCITSMALYIDIATPVTTDCKSFAPYADRIFKNNREMNSHRI